MKPGSCYQRTRLWSYADCSFRALWRGDSLHTPNHMENRSEADFWGYPICSCWQKYLQVYPVGWGRKRRTLFCIYNPMTTFVQTNSMIATNSCQSGGESWPPGATGSDCGNHHWACQAKHLERVDPSAGPHKSVGSFERAFDQIRGMNRRPREEDYRTALDQRVADTGDWVRGGAYI